MKPATVVVVDRPGEGVAFYADAVHVEARRAAIVFAVSKGADIARFKDPEFTNARTEADDRNDARRVPTPSLAASKRAARAPSPPVVIRPGEPICQSEHDTLLHVRQRVIPKRPDVRVFDVACPSFDAPTHLYRVDACDAPEAARIARAEHAADGHAPSTTWRVRVAKETT